jgi:regulator of sigma E protease
MEYFFVCIILATLILIHEAGHLLAAKAIGLPVSVFSIGFGPKLAGISLGGTEYRVSAIPLGGYCLPAIASLEEWTMIPFLKKTVLSLGGPAANIVFAVIGYIVLGLGMGMDPFSAIAGGFRKSADIFMSTIVAISMIPSHPELVSGPVGLVKAGAAAFRNGFPFLSFASLISVNLAVFNLLPIPALDGGKILIAVFEKLFPRARRVSFTAHVAGWIFIAGLLAMTLILDVRRSIG